MRVVVQAGHVARSVGSTGTAGEQPFNEAVAKMLVKELRARGVNARRIDADRPLEEYRCDYFVAIHADGSTTKTATGASVGYQSPRGKTFARSIKASYRKLAGDAGYDLLFRDDNYTKGLHFYYGTTNALSLNPRCRAVIVEAGFLTNRREREFLTSEAGQQSLALAIADSIKADQGPLGPSVDLQRLVTAFRKRRDDVLDDTEEVQGALNAEYDLHLRTDGVVDEATVAAYREHQVQLFGEGPDADGIPGRASLEALGFQVV